METRKDAGLLLLSPRPQERKIVERDAASYPLKIAVVGTRGIPSNYSGVERACEEIYPVLAARGHEITMYCRDNETRERPLTYRGVRLIYLPALSDYRLETVSHSASAMAHALCRVRPNIVHVHALGSNLFSPFCSLVNTPIVTTVHGLDWQRAKWDGLGSYMLRFSERLMLRHATEITCVSRTLSEYYWLRFGKQTIYIPNGIKSADAHEAVGSHALKKFGLSAQDYVIYLGRLEPEKRVGDLLIAYRQIDVPQRLVIVGEGNNQVYIDSLRALANGDDRIVFTGLQQGDDLRCLIAHAQLYVSASEVEGLPLALLECLAMGVPPVLSNIPGHREIMNGFVGYDLFFEPGDIAWLSQRMRLLFARTEHYAKLIRDSLPTVMLEYDWENIINQIEALYYRAVEKRGGGRAARFFW